MKMPSSKRVLLSVFALILSLACSIDAACPVGDVYPDCTVNLLDLRDFAVKWLDSECLVPGCSANIDGIPGVDMEDFALLAENWLSRGKWTLVINEFMAENDGTKRDPFDNDYEDWIELYNYGDDPIDIGGMYMTDDSHWWRIPAGYSAQTTIVAGGYLLLWADSEPEQGPLHLNFGLGKTGDMVGLYDAYRNPIDSITFGPLAEGWADKSYGRLPDANDHWEVFGIGRTTPGQSNRARPVEVLINEIMYHPGHPLNTPENIGQEYIELYNKGQEAVNVGGWRFTNGVDFVVPGGVQLGSGGYLIVAADVNVFTAKYPGVTNVVGGWDGHLSNSGEVVELVDSAGVLVDKLQYADQGDWAVRFLGPVERAHRGWEWSDETDGGGKSLELINPAVSNEYGQNWSASNVNGGTPGGANLAYDSDIAPLILDVEHFPIIPGPSNTVTVTARIIDEQPTVAAVRLHYRIDRSVYTGNESIYPHYEPNDYNDVPMFDDGVHGDGAAGDGLYGAQIPAYAHGSIIEFFVEARDAAANSRTWPAPSTIDGTPQQVTNLLYQVDSSFDPQAWVAGDQPIYYIIMTEMERARLEDIVRNHSNLEGPNSQMNGTFISVDGVDMKVRYGVGVRNRGHGTRNDWPNNYHVNFVHGRPWKDVTAINLNTAYTYLQSAGGAVFRLSGLAQCEAGAVQVRTNGQNLAESGQKMYSSYVHVEAVDNDFAANHFPDDGEGNAYKAMRVTHQADLSYEGALPGPYRQNYFKETNASADDWSDLIELCYVLDEAPDANYVEEVNRVLDAEQWLRLIAVNVLLSNAETTLANGNGDDYYLYRGFNDTRFVLVQHDLDSIFGMGQNPGSATADIFLVANIPTMNRFVKHPQFVPRYYYHLKDLIETTFSPERMNPFLDELLGGFVPPGTIQQMKDFVVQRNAYVLSRIPSAFAINSDLLLVSGYHQATVNTCALYGTADAIKTRSVLVNGEPAGWLPVDGRWSISGTDLNPGINRIIVRAYDGPNGTGNEIDNGYIDIWYNDGGMSDISGTLAADRTLDAASGPWHVTGDIVVPAGRTLTIEAGTTLFFDAGKRLTVNGRLVAEGTEFGRIRFTKTPGGGSWAGFEFLNTGQDNRIAYADMEYCDSGSCAIHANLARVYMDHVVWGNHTNQYLTFDDSSIILTNSVLPSVTNAELVHYWGFPADGYALFEGNWFGSTTGYNDIIDFTGGQRPGPIVQFLNNIFTGASDDCIDLDAADAHVEGNVFMHVHMDSPRESKSHAVTTGTEYGQVSELTVVRNLFYDVDHALLSKDGGFITAVNNTIVHATVAAVNMYEPRSGQWQGLGFYGDGNIFYDVAHMFENPDWVGHPTSITMDNSIFPIIPGDPIVWTGSGNIYDVDPQLYNTTDVTDPRIDFGFRPDSPGSGTGPNGRDMGGLVPAGASISGEPAAVTRETTATLTVGGPDIYGYKYRVNSGPWSGQILRPDPVLPGTPIQPLAPIHLTGLADGTYTVYVIIKNSASMWQAESEAVASRTWTVDSSYYPPLGLVINEVLAHTHGSEPDLIELYYDGPKRIDLAGMSLSDNPTDPDKFVFSFANVFTTIMNPGDYMVLYGDLNTGVRNHIGFGLLADGEALYLYDKAKPDGSRDLIDSVEFGPQINEFSIGRVGWDRSWRLNRMTFGMANIAQPLGNADTLKINEWLANGQVLFDDDFIELYNPHPLPVALGGMYLTDNPITQPGKHRIVPLSFIPPQGYTVFRANDGNEPSEVDFKLSADGEMIGLFDGELNMIDQVLYGPQTTDVSQGRAPDGSSNYEFFELPTPGVANTPPSIITTTTTVLAPESKTKRVLIPTGPISDDWKGGNEPFNDTGWNDGTYISGKTGGVGYDRNPDYKPYISYDVQPKMDNKNGTCYIRIPFTVDPNDLGNITNMTLRVRYDDAFVAYLNGEKVASTDRIPSPLVWSSLATSSRSSDSTAFGSFDVSAYIDKLGPSGNILAIHGLNAPVGSSDFLISAELEATVTTVEYGEFPYPDALDQLAGLRITELMYHDPSGSNFDYIELKNISDEVLNLEGVQFIQGVEFVFPNMELEAGEYVVVVSNLAAFESRYGTGHKVAGEYSGGLSGGGEDIVLTLAWPLDAAIMRFGYSDRWYPTTDGGGQSLHIIDATAHPATWDEAKSWRAAAPSPGAP